MSVAVEFVYTRWAARYPEFAATVTPPQAAEFFVEAGVYHDNTGKPGGVSNVDQQLILLNMLVAHIAQLANGSKNQPVSQLVGRISDASEGSVSVSTDMGAGLEERAAYFSQTKYGLNYWQATRQYRTGRYMAPIQRTLPGPF